MRSAAAALFAALLAAPGCKRGGAPEERRNPAPAAAAAPDPNANGERLRTATRESRERFQSLGNPADCSSILKAAEDQKACADARAALAQVNGAFGRGAPAREMIPLLGALALSAQRAAQKLRAEGVARLFESRPTPLGVEARAAPSRASANPNGNAESAIPSGSATRRAKAAASASPNAAPSSQRAGTLSPLTSAAKAPTRVQDDPELKIIVSYARCATVALSELRSYLELAPRELRESALGELERLVREEPIWAGLRALVNEASLVETDSALKARLQKLKTQLGPD